MTKIARRPLGKRMVIEEVEDASIPVTIQEDQLGQKLLLPRSLNILQGLGLNLSPNPKPYYSYPRMTQY